MATVFVSPGVFTRELDLSFVPAAVQEIGACLVGPTMAGPAFTPTIINTYEDFRRIYGDTNQELYMPYAAKNYLTNGSAMTVMRVLGTESTTEAGRGYYIRFGGTGMTGSVMAIIRARRGETLTGAVTMSGTPTNFALAYGVDDGSNPGGDVGYTANNLSFDQGSANYIKNRLGTDPVASGSTDELGTFYIDRVFDYNFDLVNSKGLKYNGPESYATLAASGETGQGSLVCSQYNPLSFGIADGGSGGVTSMIGMQTLQDVHDVEGKFWSSYNNALTPWVVSQNVNGNAQSLFRFHSLESGEGSNTKIKVGIIYQAEQVSASSYPKFTVTIRKFTDTDNNPVGLESFSNVNLDKNSSSYIAKVIGDRYSIWEGLGGAGSPELTFGGQYDNKSSYIRVEMTTDQLQSNHRASGYQGIPKPKTPMDSLMAWTGNVDESAYDYDLSAYATSSIPQLRYKTDNFIQGTTPAPNKYLGINYDSADISSRLSGLVTLGPISSATDSTTNDPGFMIFKEAELTSNSGNLSGTIGGWINDWTGTDTAGYLPNSSTLGAAFDTPKQFYHTVYDGVGTAANTAKYYQFTIPLYGGFDALDPRIKLSTAVKNGSLSSAYFDASDILSNADEFDYNLLAFPGVSNASVGNPQARAIDMCAGRGDAMFLAELGQSSDGATDDKTMSVATAVQKAAQIDSSYAGAWYPWLRIYDADLDDLVWVPPSVETLGVLAFTDIVADPWFAPAGFNRGGLPNVIEAYRRLTQGQRDTLYEGKVNPIATFAGAGIFVFGQKTLQNAASALDRINVRRMLLYCRKLVASTARTVLFEQNSLQTRNKLSNMINEILRPVKVRQGLSEFRVVINETNNTPDTIDRNQIFGAIYMQPTKTAEMIILDFNIERTGATFEEA